jgi:long-chain acyl-CoA synthetase
MSEKTIVDYFQDNVAKFGDRRWFTQPMGGGEENLKFFSFNEVLAEAKKMAGYIESLGLEPKSQIAICSKNCAWWIIADLAIFMAGHVTVPVYPTLTAETTKYILEHSESKLLFVGKLDEKPWKEMKEGIPDGLATVSFPLCPGENCAEKKWDDVMTSASPIKEPVKRSLDEMATIIYTSGSTGTPKGVMTSFRAMTECTVGVCKVLKVTEKDRYLSYLPVAHGMDRWLGECVPLYSGTSLFFAESLATFLVDLNRCRPTLFLSVPRLWTKFQSGIFTKLPPKKLNFLLKIPIVSSLVKKKVRKGLGLDQVRFAGSGSAPLPQELLEWYRKMGLELLEGYGMTENFNYSHLSMPGKVQAGYVGNTYEGVECRIAEDGEIQVKTPGKMMGYFKNEEATKEALTEDGWVRTGDKGSLDEQSRLKITGRTKEIFKTSKGKYVAPSPIENLFIPHVNVELACVSGKGEPQPHIIIQLEEGTKKEAGKGSKEREEIGKALESHMVDTVNPQLDPHEHLQFLVIVKDDWVPENGFLTPTQKIKRNVIEDTYGPNVEGWYGEKKKVIWYGW